MSQPYALMGHKIYKAVRAAGVKNIELEKLLDVNHDTIWKTFTGYRRPTLDELAVICNLTKKTFDFFLADEPKFKTAVTPPHTNPHAIPLVTWAHLKQTENFSLFYPILSNTPTIVPPVIGGELMFATQITTNEYFPAFVVNDYIVIDPDKEPRDGCFVVVRHWSLNIDIIRKYQLSEEGPELVHPSKRENEAILFVPNGEYRIIGVIVSKSQLMI